MKYAIDTLAIELAKCKEALRTEGKYSVYPEYDNSLNLPFILYINELTEAIRILEEQQ